jgi:thymidylate synthase (FAD)
MKAEYIQHVGTDLTVVNAARVSFDKESAFEDAIIPGLDPAKFPHFVIPEEAQKPTPVKVIKTADCRLISYLAKHNHFTPFTHTAITLRETVPIFVARQRFKHVVGFTYNEVSRRYVDSEPDFFVPEAWRKRAENKKQGSSDETTGEWGFGMYNAAVGKCLDVYRDMIAYGVCPEQARMVLPQSMYTSYYVTGSLAAYARLYKLRIDPHAQKEIQDLAKMIGDVIEPLFPVSWKALTETA